MTIPSPWTTSTSTSTGAPATMRSYLHEVRATQVAAPTTLNTPSVS